MLLPGRIEPAVARSRGKIQLLKCGGEQTGKELKPETVDFLRLYVNSTQKMPMVLQTSPTVSTIREDTFGHLLRAGKITGGRGPYIMLVFKGDKYDV